MSSFGCLWDEDPLKIEDISAPWEAEEELHAFLATLEEQETAEGNNDEAENAIRFECMWLERTNIQPGLIELFEAFVSGESE